ncbi:MAG: ankyrin repeat domain-containing protein [Campylobacter sp.]|nr:ankyrin repeat domain-containing protein [Campylobacter sp.]
MISQSEQKRYDELCVMALDFARKNEWQTLQKMIEHGFNPNFKDHKGNTLLMLASYNGAYECAKMLLDKGAKVDEKNAHGQTPLAGVCFKGYFEIAKLLVQRGANIDENNGLGATPYTFAVMFGNRAIAEFLLENSRKKSLLKRASLKFLSIFKKDKLTQI